MMTFKEWLGDTGNGDSAVFGRVTGRLSWLLLALVALHINILPLDRNGELLLTVASVAIFCYRTLADWRLPAWPLKPSVDLLLLCGFLVLVCWLTGKGSSPYLAAFYLLLTASALSLGRRITYLLVAFTMASSLVLVSGEQPAAAAPLAATVVRLLPLLLTSCCAALFAREADGARAKAERLSLTDDLTELHNMRSFHNLAQQQEKLARRYRKPFAICMIDADNLKEVNDRHGHLAGTELIKWTGRIISQNTRECDIAARFGGDEFVIMYEGHDKERIRAAVERIVRTMAGYPFTFEGHRIEATLSAGIASFPADGLDLRTVMMRADEAVYRSKRLGKNRVTLYQEEGRKGRGGLQVGGEQLGGGVPELRRKTAAVHLGEGDLPGDGKGGGATLLQDLRKR